MVTVVVCAYTEARWKQTRAAVESVLAQSPAPQQVLLIVDHNQSLAQRARRELPKITVLESGEPPGLSGARNTGLRNAKQPVTVFLDDDAEARPGWLARLVEPYHNPDVVATGGSVHPRWPDSRPRWLPATFDWVVGCSYRGLPEAGGAIRNPIGANMSLRTQEALTAGGFNTAVGRVGSHPRGCEETELAIRLTMGRPGSAVYYVPDAAVDHHVPPERLAIGYFLRRCWHEGQSKADIVELGGAADGLRSERRHIAVTIPAAIMQDARAAILGESVAVTRIVMALTGLAVTAAGYLTMRLRLAARPPIRQGAPAQVSSVTRQVEVGPHRIEATVSGSGAPAVVLEAGFGGTAASWRTVPEAVAKDTTVVTYDRVPYGASSQARDARTPQDIARDLNGVLDALGITRPVVLAGHSAGGLYARAFTGLYDSQVAGLVLVDSSHEAMEQMVFPELAWHIRVASRLMFPVALMLPRKARGGADRRSLIREHRALQRLTASDQPLAAGGLGDRPLIVITAGPGRAMNGRAWQIWRGLHAELAGLSTNRRHIVASHTRHYVHKSDPDLVINAIRDVVHSARTHTPLTAPAGTGHDR